MIVAQSQIHDRLDDNLTVYDDWSVLNRVHAEYAALWRVDDRGAQQRSVDATVGDGKGATFKVGQSQFAGVGLDGEIGNLLLDFGKVSWSALRRTGTTRPRLVLTAMPIS